MSRYLTAIRFLALLPAVLASNSFALGLGDIEVQSYFGQPLKARIEIVRAPGEDGSEVAIEEGSALDYRRVGVTASGYSFVFDATPTADAQDDGTIHVRSGQAIESLFIDLVVVVSSGTSLQIKHYPILLDPPPTQDIAPPTPAPLSAADPVTRAPRSETSMPTVDAPPPISRATVAAGSGRWRVQPGDTLGEIASQVAGEGSPSAVAEAILALNPRAFIGGDPDRIMAGVTLRLPEGAVDVPQDAASVPAAAADDDSNLLGRPTIAGVAGREFRRADETDRVRLRAPPGADEVVSRLGSWIRADDEELLAQSESIRRDMAYAQTEITTFRNENANLRERIDLLETRVTTLRRLIELRRAEDAEPQAGEAQVATAAPEAPKPAVDRAVAVGANAESTGADPVTLDAGVSQPPEPEPASPGWLWYLLLALVVAVGAVLLVRRWMVARGRRDVMNARLAELRGGEGPLSLPDDL